MALSSFGSPSTIACAYDSHGPVFSLATPTNGKGGWSLNFGVMTRYGANKTGAMVRGMLAYGLNADLMVSVSTPVVLYSGPFTPGRMTGMMPGTGDFEGMVSWRFHRQGLDIGSRFESTVYVGVILPGIQETAGRSDPLKKSAGILTAVATGFASRSHYLWVGLGYQLFAQSEGDKRPDLLFYSIAWGYRPPAFRKDYPHWDWRLFVELTGENSSLVEQSGIKVSDTGGQQIFIGPTTLGIYKNVAIEGGIQFPIYRNVGSRHLKENLRVALNFSYFF